MMVWHMLMQGLAERRKQKGAVTWKHRPFINQARRDGLQLKHWVKCAKDATGQVREVNEGDYPFAKCNKQVRHPVTSKLKQKTCP